MFANEGLTNLDLARLKSAIDEAAIVAITDKNGIITYVNKKFCAISKFNAYELLGQTHKIINSNYHPKDFFTQMWQTISSGNIWEGEIRNRAKDGTIYWVHTTIVPFFDKFGKPEKYVSVRYEITDRVVAQEQLRISNRELQDFASIAAHDLQEPLRKIHSFSDRLQIKAHDVLNNENRDYLDRIMKSVSRMQTLINDLLTYSRVTTKAQPFILIDLNQILEQVTSDLELLIEQNHGSIQSDYLPKIEADPTQMRQLFQNLLSNSLKFSKPLVSPKISIKSFISDENFELHFLDNGIGFDEKYIDKIFAIFQRLHGKFEYEGNGIGLAVVKKIVDRHGGIVTAKSSPGSGATFIVKLPRTQSTRSML